jgi:small GTP-binding protein
MGGLFSSISAWISGKREVRVLILGLDSAGKTTILYRLQLDQMIEHIIPTVAFNLETVDVGNLKLHIWDLGGQNQLRQFWHLYFANTHGVVFVIDSADRQRVELCANELKALFAEHELHGVPLCVLANKQDLPDAMNVGDLSARLGLSKYKDRPWTIMPASALQGTGVREAFDWLAEAMETLNTRSHSVLK